MPHATTLSPISTVRLHALDRPALEAHFIQLDSEDRRLRFGSGISDAALRDYVRGIDFERDGIFAVQDDALRPLAVVHVAMGGGPAEMGLSVLPQSRGQGLGDALFRRAVTFLRNRGVGSVFMHCLSENAAIMHLARKHRMRMVRHGSESDARLELEPATADSFISEWLDDQRGRAVQAGFTQPAARAP